MLRERAEEGSECNMSHTVKGLLTREEQCPPVTLEQVLRTIHALELKSLGRIKKS